MNYTPRLNLPLIHSGQAQKEITHNEALSMLDVLINPAQKIGQGWRFVTPSKWLEVTLDRDGSKHRFNGEYWAPSSMGVCHKLCVSCKKIQ
ncbi:MAG: hypothetical protein COA94_00970 [Rickettsiales bacterium]|nr:MAG: hypothetical protein COA94_00970 [Rickettsiales bacterium]